MSGATEKPSPNTPWNHYGASAGRPAGKSGRELRPKSTTIDIHAHVIVPEAKDFVRPHIDWSTVPLAHFAAPETKQLAFQQDKERSPHMSDVKVRLADMDAMGVDIQVLSPSPFQCYYTLPIEIADPATRMVNDGIAAHVAQCPERLVPLGTVALQDAAAAVTELKRCMSVLGFKGVQILTNVAGRELSDEALRPFWQAAQDLDALVILHPNGFTEGKRLARFYFNNTIGNPLDTTVAIHYLIFDGILQQFPALKILAVHGGGYVGAYAARMDHAWGARSDCHGTLPKPPSTYLRQLYFDTVVFSPHQLQFLIEAQGVDQVLMGTDYAFDMAESDPVSLIMNVPGLKAKERAKIIGGNAEKLLGIHRLVASMASHG
jgi:aminocarboxymuconate-semialdehyde decarboxylase